MPERFRGDAPSQEHEAQSEPKEFTEGQERVIEEFKEAVKAYEQAKERLKNYQVRFTSDKGFEPISFYEAIEEDKEIQEEVERINSELQGDYVLKVEPYAPHGEVQEDCSIIYISDDGEETFENYATTSNTAETLHYLSKINKADIDDYFETRKRNRASSD